MIRLRYVSKDHAHRLYGCEGAKLAQGRGPGPRNTMVRLDTGEVVIARGATGGRHETQSR